jgi:hypothetical protein
MPGKLKNGNVVRLTNASTGRSLRITAEGELNGNGGNGKWAKFTVHHDGDIVRFQNVGDSSNWVRTMPDGDSNGGGKGGKHCKYTIAARNPFIFTSVHGGNLGIKSDGSAKNAKNTHQGEHAQFAIEVLDN